MKSVRTDIKLAGIGKRAVFNVSGEPRLYSSFDELNGTRLMGINNNMLSVLRDKEPLDFYVRECFDLIYLSKFPEKDDVSRLFIEPRVAMNLLGEKISIAKKGYYKDEDVSKDLPAFVVIRTEAPNRLYQVSGDDGYIWIEEYPTKNPATPHQSSEAYEKFFCKRILEF